MRKVLLASTALVALGSASAMAADVTISGNTTWQYESYDKNGGFTEAANGTSIDHDSDVDFKFVNTTDSGLTITMAVGLNEGGSQDDQKLTIAGDFGSIRLSNDQEGVGDSVISATAMTNDETTKVKSASEEYLTNYGTSMSSGTMVSYYTPAVNGLSAAVSIADAGTSVQSDVTEAIVTYSTAFEGGTVKINYASSSMDDNGTSGARSGKDATSFGIQIGMGALTFAASSNTLSENDDTNDWSSTTVGASYALGNGMTVGVANVNSEDDKNTQWGYEQTAASVTYSIAPGLSAGLTVTSSKETGTTGTTENKDDFTVLELSASF